MDFDVYLSVAWLGVGIIDILHTKRMFQRVKKNQGISFGHAIAEQTVKHRRSNSNIFLNNFLKKEKIFSEITLKC